ncbi:hypothetical protein [Bradyrhizobium sp.]|uniref:hypothetical protein n=1 Tax=Bradyrhizobium sp. TaxID=376 RepID=UPI003C6F1F02
MIAANCLEVRATVLHAAPPDPRTIAKWSLSTPLKRTGTPSSIENPTAVQDGFSCTSRMRGNALVKLTLQPGNSRIICRAEILLTSGVKSTSTFRIELRNSSAS